MKILIVESRYYEGVASELLKGVKSALEEARVDFDIVNVAGSLEIPAAIKFAHSASENTGEKYAGYIALGCVIRGETKHFDIVSMESARGIMDLTIQYDLAIANAILTVENKEQAMVRASTNGKNLGYNAGKTCLEMIKLREKLNGNKNKNE
jgi:6,7-dimethyl-8-ribityllumazine synthase